MPAAVFDLRTTDDPRDIVHRVVQALAEGKLVALPTETAYAIAASAFHEPAIARLEALQRKRQESPLSLAIRSVECAGDYVPRMCPLADRLARRCWPGPVILVLDHDKADSLARQLPTSVQRAISPNGQISFRVPAHDLFLDVLRLAASPLAVASAVLMNTQEAVSGQELVAEFGSEIDLIIDDGRSKFAQPPSVIHVRQGQFQVLHSGVLNEAALGRLASFLVLFVCTGNTCRSPMAEHLMKQRIAERYRCRPAELEERGILVMSAGVSATVGGRASSEAVQVLQDRGLDLSHHESQPVSDRLVRYADLILTMTRGHRDSILGQWPDAAPRVHLLGHVHGDIADPFGGTREDYRKCANEIEGHLDAWLDECQRRDLLPSSLNG